jgi:hypothetical protein
MYVIMFAVNKKERKKDLYIPTIDLPILLQENM